MATKTTTQFDLNSFIKEQMLQDVKDINVAESTVKGTVKKVLTHTGGAIVQGAIALKNGGIMINNALLEEVWDSRENLYKRMLERASEGDKQ